MNTFTIDHDGNITAYGATEQVPEGSQRFATQKEFARITSEWPLSQFVGLWNSFAGAVPFEDLKPVKKFTDRKTAVSRIWRAIQALTLASVPQVAPAAPKRPKATKKATSTEGTPTARSGSKKAIVLDMLKRPEGATLQDIMSETGWMAHSVRGFLSGSLAKKMGLKIESSKREDGARVYRIA